jgi:hypothetical protein
MVRALRADALVKPLEAPIRTFVLVARDWPSEAQNALLKLLEEPPSSAEFILVVPRVDVLLPTVRSRVLLSTRSELAVSAPEVSPVFQTFLASSYAVRLECIASWAKDKAITDMEHVLRGAEEYAHARALSHPAVLGSVIAVRGHFSQSGAARKMLLEEIALTLPVT